MIMMRFLALILSLVATGWSSAWACSIIVENRKDEFQYDHLSPTIYDDDWTPFDKNALEGLAKGQVPFDHILQSNDVYLAKAQVNKSDITVPHYGDLPLGLVEFKIVETLKGKKRDTIWLSTDTKTITPVMDVSRTPKKFKLKEQLKDMTNEMIASHDNFWFWDTQIAPKTLLGSPYGGTSCGPIYLPQVLDNTHYIVFPNFFAMNYIPVSGENDTLVKTLKTAIAAKSRVRLPLSVKEYFQNIDFAYPVILDCKRAIKTANHGKDWWDPFTDFPLFDSSSKGPGATFASYPGGAIIDPPGRLGAIIKPDHMSRLNGDWPAIFVFYGDRDRKLLTCEKDEDFLVYGSENSARFSTDAINHNGKHYVNLPKYRFAKIIDGEILTSSIKTNYALRGEDRIPLETVMNWISKANPN